MRVRDRLLQKFNDFKYRHAYVDDFTDAFIATQIKVLREQQGLTQTQLADKAGMKQSQISELEDVNHQGWKVRTLKKLAKAFDLALVVRFEPFGRVLDDIVGFDRQHLQRDTFKDDAVFCKNAQVVTGTTETLDPLNVYNIVTGHQGGLVLNSTARFAKASRGEFDTRVSNVA